MLQHRVRAAVILVEDQSLLLVKHVHPQTGFTWWIPPGGGLEDADASLLACAKREVHEETGLDVDIGKLLYLREFLEMDADVHHVELLFDGHNPQGELTLDNVAGTGPDEDYIRDVAWVPRQDLAGLTVYPEHLADGFWDDRRAGLTAVKYLGVSVG